MVDYLVTNFAENVPVKEFWKSIKILAQLWLRMYLHEITLKSLCVLWVGTCSESATSPRIKPVLSVYILNTNYVIMCLCVSDLLGGGSGRYSGRDSGTTSCSRDSGTVLDSSQQSSQYFNSQQDWSNHDSQSQRMSQDSSRPSQPHQVQPAVSKFLFFLFLVTINQRITLVLLSFF